MVALGQRIARGVRERDGARERGDGVSPEAAQRTKGELGGRPRNGLHGEQSQAVSDRSEGPEPESERSAGVANLHARSDKSRR